MDEQSSWADARCAVTSSDLDEQLAGTAPRTRAWLLIEHHGPWGRKGFPDSGLPENLVADVGARAETLGVRIQLIRRHGRDGRAAPPDTAYLVRSVSGSSWARRFRVDGPGDLGDLPLEAVADPETPALGDAVTTPLHLVCTHGRRDACCAQLGRSTAGAFASIASETDDVWETTHTGGHRFAANVVVLPSGHVYGRVGPDQAAAIVAAHASHQVVPALLRGRSCDDPWGQVADVAVRRHLGMTGIDDVRVAESRTTGEDATVTLEIAGSGTVAVALRHSQTGHPRPYSCGDLDLRDPGLVEVVGIDRAAATA